MHNLVTTDLKHIWHPCSQMKDYEELPPIVIDHAEGVNLYDIDGKRYIDIISSWWCNLLGHCNPKISAAIKAQLDQVEHVVFANFSHAPAIRLCERLLKHLPNGLVKFNFSDNGSAAIECALKMSFQYQFQTGHPEKKHFMTLSDGYHGETIGALSVGGLDLYAEIYAPMLMDAFHVEAPDCYRCRHGKLRDSCHAECFERTKAAFERHAHETCAFICEPLLQGAAGMRIYPPKYLERLRAACSHYGILLIADEIATGFGRTGKFFACDHAGIAPDILCLSKGLTGGYLPMSLTITTQTIYDAFYADFREGKAFMHSHTYSGSPLGCSAALAVLDLLENEPILEIAAENAVYLHEQLMLALGSHRHVGEIRHLGLINAIELVADRSNKARFDSTRRLGYQIYKRALAKGLVLRPLGDVLYFNPPLVISREDIDAAIAICKAALTEELGGA
jgi:adenosylmethionine---8-amino-7-oxononanoate aminotransferase